jgi:hypothetical protein
MPATAFLQNKHNNWGKVSCKCCYRVHCETKSDMEPLSEMGFQENHYVYEVHNKISLRKLNFYGHLQGIYEDLI